MFGLAIFAKHPETVAQFYERLLNISVTEVESDYRKLEGDGFELMILQPPAAIANNIDLTTPPQIRSETATKPIFPVVSIAKAREVATQLNGGVKSIEQQWEFQGKQVCDGFDCEGNVFQLQELES